MHKSTSQAVVSSLFIGVLTLLGGSAFAASDEELIANATAAAPPGVAATASVMVVNADGTMRMVHQGTGTFTCMPNDPATPVNDPMCVDANGMQWVEAWLAHKDPPAGKIGVAYMLQGGWAPNNTDPYATVPAAGETAFEDPPHIMIFNAPELIALYPAPTGVPDGHAPYVMYPNTPYAHLMVPVH